MSEAAELDRAVAKTDCESEVARLRLELLDMQRRLEQHPFPLLVVFGGVDAAGQSETVHLLNEWMDPRWIVNRAFDAPSQDERDRSLVVSTGELDQGRVRQRARPDPLDRAGAMTARVQGIAACGPAAVPAPGSPTR